MNIMALFYAAKLDFSAENNTFAVSINHNIS